MSELLKGFERIEEARERFMGPSFMAGLYDGCPDFDLLLPPPEPLEEKAVGDAFCKQIEAFLVRHVDPEQIERQAKIPEEVIQGLSRDDVLERPQLSFILSGADQLDAIWHRLEIT